MAESEPLGLAEALMEFLHGQQRAAGLSLADQLACLAVMGTFCSTEGYPGFLAFIDQLAEKVPGLSPPPASTQQEMVMAAQTAGQLARFLAALGGS